MWMPTFLVSLFLTLKPEVFGDQEAQDAMDTGHRATWQCCS